MPEIAPNAITIERLKPEANRVRYRLRGERGLHIEVHPSGKKTWVLKYQVGAGARRTQRARLLGDQSTMTLAKAREEAIAVLMRASKGDDPAARGGRGVSSGPITFDDAFRRWLAEYAKVKLRGWQDEEKRYHRHLSAKLGTMPLAEITRGEIKDVRDYVAEARKVRVEGRNKPVKRGGGAESNHVLALINRVLNWAVEEELLKFNPGALVHKVGAERRRERFLDDEMIVAFWTELSRAPAIGHERGGQTEADLRDAQVMALALRFALVTGQRIGECLGLSAKELTRDGSQAMWRIPEARSKNKLPHELPLPPLACEIIAEAQRLTGSNRIVFVSSKTRKAFDRTSAKNRMERTMKRLRLPHVTPHDLRRTVGRQMRKLGISTDDRGHVFNHVSGAKSKVTSWNYDPGDHNEEKLAALTKWEVKLRELIAAGAERSGSRYDPEPRDAAGHTAEHLSEEA